MVTRVTWKIAAPMVGMSAVLLGLGAFAAWNVHQQQRTSSELIAQEVHGLLVIDELHLCVREIRYQLNLFLRTRERRHLQMADKLYQEGQSLLLRARALARTNREKELINVVDAGYQHALKDFQEFSASVVPSDDAGSLISQIDPVVALGLSHLSDEVLTNEVLGPLFECILVNRQVVERTNEVSQATAQHMKIGFLMLGLCGGASGLLMGTGIARTIGRSIVQLDISVRSVAGRLSDVTGPVLFSHTGNLASLESGLRKLEDDIARVVERLQQRETELLRSEQLAQVGQLAAGVAHELRNPLMPMKMLVQAALTKGDEGGLKRPALRILDEEISRLEQAIQTLLDFAKPPAPEMALASVNEIVQQTVELIKGRAELQDVELRLSMPDRPVLATVDRNQLRQLFLNLLLNALDAMPRGGEIEIAVQRVVASSGPNAEAMDAGALTEHDAIRLANLPRAAAQSDLFQVRIADNGPGILPAMQKSIFDPFVTTKETGTGLGLSICQRIAAAHQGTLTVHNRISGGAEFRVLLPYHVGV